MPRENSRLEDYLRRIHCLSQKKPVRAAELARDLGVSRATVCVFIKQLQEEGYVSVGERHILTLTPKGAEIAEYVELDELLCRADVVSLHCPLFPETRGIINRETISKMKDGVIIINNSRGPLVVEQDLADALNSGKVYAAGLDVVSSEPISADNPLLKAKNCLITPHISWAPRESRQRIMDCTVENIRAFQAGKPQNVVN